MHEGRGALESSRPMFLAHVLEMRLTCHTATACHGFLGSLNMGVDGSLSLSKYC